MLKWLEQWYLSNCNGDWEHCFGLRIKYTTNQGWNVSIELDETDAEDLVLASHEIYNSDTDWIRYKIEKRCFHGSGDFTKIKQILLVFKELIEKNAEAVYANLG